MAVRRVLLWCLHAPQALFTPQVPVLAVVAVFFVLAGCTSAYNTGDPYPDIVALKTPSTQLGLDQVAQLAPSPDLLALDADMVAFVERYTRGLYSHRQRLINLHSAVKSPALLGLEYDTFAEGTAIESFHSGRVNCLSYAHLFTALAREAGLNAHYQLVDVRPTWSRLGERVAVGLHVNVVIGLRGSKEYMADIDPLAPGDIIGTRRLSDTDALALYHSNLAMADLTEEHLDTAWANAVRAIQLSPSMAHLWVNLGAVYRHAGQYDEAKQSYFYALELNSKDRSAMNNLMVLYALLGDQEQFAIWQSQIERYRSKNPYYHAWLGDKAGESGDWAGALEHYQQAVQLDPGDSYLLYGTGLAHYRLDDFDAASQLLTEAIANARLRSEIDTYRSQLEQVRLDQMAAL
ncbi:MAG: tetratricopeptide repeat protein [Halioglobus sp.]